MSRTKRNGRKLVTTIAVVTMSLAAANASAEVARTLDAVQGLNHAVAEAYAPLHPYWVPQMGVHWGVPGPSVILAVADHDVVAAYEIIVPEVAGWFPWFDQAEGEPMIHPELGPVYTQHIYVTDPQTVIEGRRPSYVPMKWSELVAVNPKLGEYGPISDWIPRMGFHYGPSSPGPALLVMVGANDEVFGFEIIQPAEHGWHPWFDQPEGEPMMFPFGPAYTQHVYVVDPGTIAAIQ